MATKPMIRSNICLNSHPKGCAVAVRSQIAYIKQQFADEKPEKTVKLALIVGCSTGYGLASRIAAGFGYGAATVGLSFEKEGSEKKCGTPGWYNNLTYDTDAAAAGLKSATLNGDAFSNEMKEKTIACVRELAGAAGIAPKIDLLIYSLASPVRTDPKTGIMHKSVIKPIGAAYSGKTFDIVSGKINIVSAEPASEEEIAATVKVMGGEDWELWIEALEAANMLSDICRTVAYTYIGPELSWAIYKNGTIGHAKEDLERAAKAINRKFDGTAKAAFVSVNKAVVTRSSAVIPIIPLYIASLFKVMKDKNLHEGCIEQIARLYKERLYRKEAALDSKKVPVDAEGRIRIDDREMQDDVQRATVAQMEKITEENIFQQSDVAGFKHDFLEAHGFDIAGIDYESEVATDRI
ncbi:MAG: trans-2-enoyl-CoA reductase family protein [Termitinemataceae bacterium]|nr:MAG: trans-2-enoyl-CoA reductase family protein [Termitinemataceae bacterium]